MYKTKLSFVLGTLLFVLPYSSNFAQYSSDNWLSYEPSSGQFRLQSPPPLNRWPQSKERASWGIYLWEFGDGHFSFEEEPVHHYEGKGSYRVRLHLTPFYATNDPITLTERISPPAKAKRPPTYELSGKKALLESNSSDYIVPEQEFQLVTHYEAPNGLSGTTGGYLFVFYNKKKELNIGYEAFELTGERTHKGEEALSEEEVIPTIIARLNGGKQAAAMQLANQYKGKLAYRVEDMQAGEQARLFLSFFASPRLKSQQDKNRELTISTLWVPDRPEFNVRTYSDEHKMQILAVYDPNRIRVAPRTAYFRKGYPKTLRYTVEFQNKEEGRVRDVTIKVPIGKSLQLNTAKITGSTPRLPECSATFSGKDTSCIRLYRIRGTYKDTVRLVLRNVGLEGKKSKSLFQNKKSTKGAVEFSIETGDIKVGTDRARASIIFDEVDPVETRTARTHWRRQTAYFRPGASIGSSLKGFDNDASRLGGRTNFAFGLQNVPVSTGKAYGVEVGYSNYRFFRQVSTPVEGDGQLPPNAVLITEEHSRLGYLEPRAWGGYELKSWLRAQAGIGISIPASGKVEVQSSIQNPDDDIVILQENGISEFGLFKSKQPLSVFNAESELRNSMGLNWQFGLETGLLDVFSLGISQEMRFFPNLYHGECGTIFSWQAYIRVQLFPVGGKF